MSVESNQNKSDLTIEGQLARWEQSKYELSQRRRKHRRSTISPGSAQQMLPYINQLIDNPSSELIIPFQDFPNNARNTVYMKWKDSFIYLLEVSLTTSEEDKRKLSWIKATCKTRVMDDGIHVYPPSAQFKGLQLSGSVVAQNARKIVREAQAENAGWRDEFMEFVQAGGTGDVFHRKGLFNEPDLAFVRGICSDPETFLAKISLTEIRVTKV